MKKILFLFALIINSSFCYGQVFPNVQRSLFTEWGVHTCEPCYTWAKPMMDSFKSHYGTSLICYKEEHGSYSPGNPLSSWLGSYLWGNVYLFTIGITISTPAMFVNQVYHNHDSGNALFVSKAMHVIDSTNSLPVVASPIFWVTKYGIDSLIVNAKTKFLRADSGEFHLAVLLLQDSIYYQQDGATGGYCYHMHQLVGPGHQSDGDWNGNDSLSYRITTGAVPVNSIYAKSFHYKLKPNQVIKNIKPMVVVWKKAIVPMYDANDSIYHNLSRLLYVNATEKDDSTIFVKNPVTRPEILIQIIKG